MDFRSLGSGSTTRTRLAINGDSWRVLLVGLFIKALRAENEEEDEEPFNEETSGRSYGREIRVYSAGLNGSATSAVSSAENE